MAKPKNYGDHWEWLKAQEREIEGPTGWIQWKGTDVCIDLHCVCGHHGHLDDDFTYYYRCPKCDRIYALSQTVQLIELDKEQREFVEETRQGVIKTDDEGPELRSIAPDPEEIETATRLAKLIGVKITDLPN